MQGRTLTSALACSILVITSCASQPPSHTSSVGFRAFAAEADHLPSWNDGRAKKAILDFVKTTTDKSNPKFVAPEERIATFDQDGTTWSHTLSTRRCYLPSTEYRLWRRRIRNERRSNHSKRSSAAINSQWQSSRSRISRFWFLPLTPA